MQGPRGKIETAGKNLVPGAKHKNKYFSFFQVKLANLAKLECLERLALLEKMGLMERREALEVLALLDHQGFQVHEDNPV